MMQINAAVPNNSITIKVIGVGGGGGNAVNRMNGAGQRGKGASCHLHGTAHLAAVTDHAGDGTGHIPDGISDLFVRAAQQIGDGGGSGAVHRIGAAYRQQANTFRGFTFGGDPCTNLCLCYLFNIFCCGGRGFFLCC